MSTFGELISIVTNTLNSNTKDTRIPKRFILSVLKETGRFLISQKFRDKTLYRNTNMFTTIGCVEMEEVRGNECGIPEFNNCKVLMKSKKKLPEIINTRFGPAILGIYNVNNTKELSLTTLSKYLSMSRRKDFDLFKGENAYIVDGYLYTPDLDWKLVNLQVLTLDDDYEDCNTDPCSNPYDKEFPLPEDVAMAVVQETIKQVAMRMQIPADENPNLDSNIRSQQVE